MRHGVGGVLGAGDEVGQARDDEDGRVLLHTPETLLKYLEAGAMQNLSGLHIPVTTGSWIHVPLHVGVADQGEELGRHDVQPSRVEPQQRGNDCLEWNL